MNEYAHYKDTAMYYKDKSGEEVAYNKALKLSESELRDSVKSMLEDIGVKKPDVIIRTKTVLRIDTVNVRFTDTLPCSDFIMPFVVDSPYYKINGEISKEKLLFKELSFNNDQDIVVGMRKGGMFRNKEYVVTVKNSNPYMNVNGLSSLRIENKKKWYEKWYVYLFAGMVGGVILNQEMSK